MSDSWKRREVIGKATLYLENAQRQGRLIS